MIKKLFLTFINLFVLYSLSEASKMVPYFSKDNLKNNEKLALEVADIYDFSYKGPFSTTEEITGWTLRNADTHPESVKAIFKWLDANPDEKEAKLIHPFAGKKLVVMAMEDEKLKKELKDLQGNFKILKEDILNSKEVIESICKNKLKYPLIYKLVGNYASIHKKSKPAELFIGCDKK